MGFNMKDIKDKELFCREVGNIMNMSVLPSEKAMAFKIRMDAMRHQGKRTDLICDSDDEVLKSVIAVGQEFNHSKSQVGRYLRLTQLIPELLTMVDENKLGVNSAYELSFLDADEQLIVFENIENSEIKLTIEKAKQIKKLSQTYSFNEDVILSILQSVTKSQVENIKIPREKISKYFSPGTTPQKIEETIINALELYRKRQRDMER